MLAMFMHVVFTYIGVYFLFTRTNPITYLKNIIPAQTMAFACASSAATIPMTLKCVKASGKVPDAVARFVVPLGATVNMDGGAIYFPCAAIWLAVLNGIEVDASHYILLVIIATIGSVGTAPVPSASLVLIITAYNTVFNTSGTPDGFEFIFGTSTRFAMFCPVPTSSHPMLFLFMFRCTAIDWFMDRLRTTTNVTGDAVVAGMVAHLTSEDDVVPELDDNAEADVKVEEEA